MLPREKTKGHLRSSKFTGAVGWAGETQSNMARIPMMKVNMRSSEESPEKDMKFSVVGLTFKTFGAAHCIK